MSDSCSCLLQSTLRNGFSTGESSCACNEAVVSFLISSGASVDARDKWDHTALAHPCNASVATALIKGGAELEAANQDGWTPLLRAAAGGRTAIVRILRPNQKGDHPVHLAAKKTTSQILRILLRHGASPGARGELGRTALHWSAIWGNHSAIDTLL